MKLYHVEEYYCPRFWSHLDAIAGVFCLAAFILIVSILSLGVGMESDYSIASEVSNFSVSEDILVVGALITIITFFLLMLPMILLSTSTKFTEEEEKELLYILGINPEGEEHKEPEVAQIQAVQPSKPKDRLGSEEEGKWTFNGTKEPMPRKFGTEKEGKWTYGYLRKLDDSRPL